MRSALTSSVVCGWTGLLVAFLAGLGSSGELQILWLSPRNHTDFAVASSMGPLALAVETVIENGLLHGNTVNITWRDSECDPKTASGKFVTYLLRQRPDAVFGPPCTKAMLPVADLAAYMNIPIYSWASNIHTLDNKTSKNTLIRTIAPLSSLGKLLIFFCKKLNWSQVSIIYSNDEMSSSMAEFYREAIENDPQFNLARIKNVRSNESREAIEKVYTGLKREALIIILVIPSEEIRRYLVVADDMGMTDGNYQFLYTEQSVLDREFLKRFKSKSFWRLGDADDDKAKRGYHNLLYFTYQYVTQWELLMNESAPIEAAKRVFANDTTMPDKIEPPDKFSRFLYDAFHLYGLAFNETVFKNVTPDGRNIFDASKRKHFNGTTGSFLTNDEADRQSSFLIWDMNENDTFRQVVQTRYNQENVIWDVSAPILWGNGRLYNSSGEIYIPPDVPPCGFYDEYCPTVNLAETVAPAVTVSIMLAGVIAFFIIYRWWKNERALYETVWKVRYTELNFNIVRGPISQAGLSVITGSQKSLNDCSDNRSDSSTGNMSSSCSTFRHDNMVMISQMFTTVAKLHGDQVAVRKVRKKTVKEDKLLLKEMKMMKSLKHTNLATFYGACTEAPNICVLWEYCSKGSLEDILHNTDIKLESMFQFSIALDICTGLNYLHASEMGHHGRLKTTNCVIDSRWVAKLTDFGLKRFKKGEKPLEEVSEEKYYTDLFWTAPELLKCILNNEKVIHTKEADIYSLGIVLKQLLCKNLAYCEELVHHTPKDIVLKVANPNPETERQMRPHINEEFPEHHVVMMSFVHLIKGCWAEDPTLRPNIKRVLRKMKRMSPLKTTGVLDNMLVLMERYSTRLEDLVSERTLQLEEEKRKTDTLLYRMLPRKIADDLKVGHQIQAEAFADVTIYFSDIVGFTTLASESTPMEIVEMLNLLYSLFDDIIQNFDVYKVETIGDAYMVVCGCPEPNTNNAPIMADMALTLLDSVIHFVIPHRPQDELRIRIGLNSGPVVAGVVGNTMPRYCLFGNTVNLASRMESQGMPQRIQISFFTHEMLKDNPDFIIESRGLIEIKGKGKMPTYWLNGRKSSQPIQHELNADLPPASQANPQEGDGGDGDVRKQRSGRQSACGETCGDNRLVDSTSGMSDTGNSGGKSAVGDSRQTSGSSTSYTSFDNTQMTLTSITDIEEVSKEFGTPDSQLRNARGPNLDKCLGNGQIDTSEGSNGNHISRDQFWKEHFNNGYIAQGQNGSNSDLKQKDIDSQPQNHVTNPFENVHSLRASSSEKDKFGMEIFVNTQGLQTECLGRENLDTNLTQNSTNRELGTGRLISPIVCEEKFEPIQPPTYTISTETGSREGSPGRNGTYRSTISINTGEGPCQINLNITPMPAPPASSMTARPLSPMSAITVAPIPISPMAAPSYDRSSSHNSPSEISNFGSPPAASQVDRPQVIPLSPASTKYIQNFDPSPSKDLETDAFLGKSSTKTNENIQFFPLSPDFGASSGSFPPQAQANVINKDSVRYFCAPEESEESQMKPLNSNNLNGLTIFDMDQLNGNDLNPFVSKPTNREPLVQFQSQNSDNISKDSNSLQGQPLQTISKKSSSKFSVHPTDRSRLLNSPFWSEKSMANGKAKTFEVHLENLPKLRPHNRVGSCELLTSRSPTQGSSVWRKSMEIIKSQPSRNVDS